MENKRLSLFPPLSDLRNSLIFNDFLADYIGTEYAQDKEDHGIFFLVFMNENLKSFFEVRR
jgi:hypothetical protein